MKGKHLRLRRTHAVALVVAGLLIGVTMMATPAMGHVGGTVNHLWGHLKPKADARYANAVAGTDKAKDADKLDGSDSRAFGVSVATAARITDSNLCDEQTASLCTWVPVVVPAGQSFRITINATGSAWSTAIDRVSLRFGFRPTGTSDAPTHFGNWNAVDVPASLQTSFANAGSIVLGAGSWDVGVVTLTNGEMEIAPGDTAEVQMLATITNAAVPAP